MVCMGRHVGVARMGQAEVYRSLNEVCVVEKQNGKYSFFKGGNNELRKKAQAVFGEQRDNFEWFFCEDNVIRAKVYPALRDAFIEAPNNLFKQTVKACALTDTNLKLADTVSFEYRSQDKVCACVFEKNNLNCTVNVARLKATPYNELVLFFVSQGSPSLIQELVAPALSQVWPDLPDYHQQIVPCQYNTLNEELAKQYTPLVREMKK